jgi:chaperonin GroEL (HSP60 family)
LDIGHPIVKIFVDLATSVDNSIGDGSTSALVLAGSLLEKANELVSNNIHPNIIAEGYKTKKDTQIEEMMRTQEQFEQLIQSLIESEQLKPLNTSEYP